MRHIVLVFVLLLSISLQAQHTISGTFSPAADYTWLIAFQLRPGTQAYIADTVIKEGKFALSVPEHASEGFYRLVYALPQEEYYFDVLYNGKEDIELAFNEVDGAVFIKSEENKLFNNYFRDINAKEQGIINFYSAQKTDEKEFSYLVEQLRNTQNTYENNSKGLISHNFITANKPYFPIGFESIQDYVSHKKQHYFNTLNFNDPILQHSGFLTDKVVNYVFTGLPLVKMSQMDSEAVMQDNINLVGEQVLATDANYKIHLFDAIWTQASIYGLNGTSDFVYNSHLKSLATNSNKQEVVDKIELHNRLRLGAIAPEITWKNGGQIMSSSALDSALSYILVFWSSSCFHCLNELPKLHELVKERPNIKVIAIGLEDDDIGWKQESVKLNEFIHVISLGKWESEYGKLYAIDKTPTYFVLDMDKKISAKPTDYEELISFLNAL